MCVSVLLNHLAVYLKHTVEESKFQFKKFLMLIITQKELPKWGGGVEPDKDEAIHWRRDLSVQLEMKTSFLFHYIPKSKNWNIVVL